jgi:hypothetical protein
MDPRDVPVVMPRPANMGPIPVPPVNPDSDREITIKESHLKKEVWLAFNRGYNDGFVCGFHNAMQRRGVPPSRPAVPRTSSSGQRYRFNKNARNIKK